MCVPTRGAAPCCCFLPSLRRHSQLYTAAINACMADDGSTNFEAAFEIYATMQRHGVEPDDLLYGHLIAIAGRCRKLEVAFDLLEDMRASGLKPSTPTCSALIYACLQNNNFAAARKVGRSPWLRR